MLCGLRVPGPWDGSARSVSLEIIGGLRHCGGVNSSAACSCVSGELPIERLVAAAGDTVCRKGGVVMHNGRAVATARSADSQGRALPIWNGCVTLTTLDVFLLGDTAGSYHGRYFGVTSSAEIVGRADLLLSF